MATPDRAWDPNGAAARLVRQVEAIDAWNAARDKRKQAIEANCNSREDQLDAARRVEVLDRAQAALQERARSFLASPDPPLVVAPPPTAVLAHAHEWFATRLTEALTSRGVTVLATTENGADGLGIVVAEQPDILLVGETLAMLPGAELVAEVALFAPNTLVAAQVAYGDQIGNMLDAGAATAFTRQVPPGEVADALCALLANRTDTTMQAAR